MAKPQTLLEKHKRSPRTLQNIYAEATWPRGITITTAILLIIGSALLAAAFFSPLGPALGLSAKLLAAIAAEKLMVASLLALTGVLGGALLSLGLTLPIAAMPKRSFRSSAEMHATHAVPAPLPSSPGASASLGAMPATAHVPQRTTEVAGGVEETKADDELSAPAAGRVAS